MYTRTQKIDYINKCLSRNGKKITKKELNNWSDEAINKIINKYENDFIAFINKPKMIKYMIDGIKNDQEVSWDIEAVSIEDAKDKCSKNDITVVKIVKAYGHHRCGACGSIANGTQKDIICDECHDIFGHWFLHEL